MPADAKLDRHLISLLNELTRRLAGSGGDRAFVRLDDPAGADAGSLSAFERAGLVAKEPPARSTICDGCGQDCPMEVTWPGGNRGPFIVCDKRDDIGRVPVDPARLEQWSVSLEQLVRTTASLLDTEGTPEPAPEGTCWRLGRLRSHGTETPVRMVAADDGAAFWGLTVSLVPGARAGASIPLAELLLFRGGKLSLDRQALKRALGTRTDDPRIALEILFTSGDIVLVNRVTGRTRTLARPDFGSANDDIFQLLFANPGRRYSRIEIEAAIDNPRFKPLHKIVENLNFKGQLRKLFFDVSATAIRFKNKVAFGDLATLRIDPTKIS